VPVIEQIVDILPNFKQYMQCMAEKKGESPAPGTKSFEMVKSHAEIIFAGVPNCFVVSILKCVVA